MKITTSTLIMTILTLILAACAQVTPARTSIPTTLPTTIPLLLTMEPTPSSTMVVVTGVAPATQLMPSVQRPTFIAATYEDAANGFMLNYPKDWTLSPNQAIGSRGSQAILFSPGTTADVLEPGGTRVYITVVQWEPKNDLPAYAAMRQAEWESSGNKYVTMSSWDSADGFQMMSFVIETIDLTQAYILLTSVGDNYLQLAGEGDLVLIDEIAHTVRPLPPGQ